MVAVIPYATLFTVILGFINSDEKCWNDYQLGLDDGPAKAKKAAQMTAKSFQCSLDVVEVQGRLPTGNSCYDVGVRNGALFQLQALAVVYQCRNDDLFGVHWSVEPVPNSD